MTTKKANKTTAPKTTKAKKTKAKVGTTFVGVVLDKSGSMSFGRELTVRSFNEQLQTIAAGAKAVSGDTKVTFLTFSNEATIVCDGANADQVKELALEDYVPSGGTALYDSVSRCIDMIEAQPGAKDKDSAILMVIFTDGEENASKHVTAAHLSERIKSLEDTKRWTFTLMGPKNQVDSMADLLKINKGNIQGYDVNTLVGKAQAGGMLQSATNDYFSMRTVGATQSCDFYKNTKVEKEQPAEKPKHDAGLIFTQGVIPSFTLGKDVDPNVNKS